MARVIEYTAKDYSDALSKVGTWIAENAEKIVSDISYVRSIDLNVTIEPDCIITVNCNHEYITFVDSAPVILRNNTAK